MLKKNAPLMETDASMRPIRVVGTRIKFVVRRYEAQAYPVTSVHKPPPTTRTGYKARCEGTGRDFHAASSTRTSLRMMPKLLIASTMDSMVSMVLFFSPPAMTKAVSGMLWCLK